MASRFVLPFADVGGGITPSDGALLEFFITGTSTPKDTFTTEALNIANTNPVVANANGVFPDIWLPDGARYKVTLDDKNIVQKFESDPVIGGGSSSAAKEPFANVAAMVASTELNIGDIVETAGAITKGDGGQNQHEIVAAATGTADGGSFIDLTGITGQAKGLFPGGIQVSTQFQAVGDNSTDDTTEIQAWLDFVKSINGHGVINKISKVSTVIIDGVNGMKLSGKGALSGDGLVAHDAVLELKSCTDLAIEREFSVTANFSTNYTAGVKVWSDGTPTSSLLNLKCIVTGAQLAWQFGDSANPDALLSEMNLTEGYTFGCPRVLEVFGSQAVVNVSDYQLVSSLGSGTGSWLTLPRGVIRAIGALVQVSGGEIILADVTTGETLNVRPINSPGFDDAYGKIVCSNVEIESASQMATATNPGAVASPVRGELSFSQCGGVHTSNSFAFVLTASDYVGDVSFKDCSFFSTVARTQPNVQADGNAHLYVDEKSFGTNFLQGLSGLVGGIVHFSNRQIGYYVNVAGQSIPNATQTVLNFTVENTGNSFDRFNGDHLAGVFTVPTGGLQGVMVSAQFLLVGTDTVNSEFYIRLNGTAVGVTKNDVYQSDTIFLGDLVATDTIDVVFNNLSAGALTAGSTVTDFFQISAWN